MAKPALILVGVLMSSIFSFNAQAFPASYAPQRVTSDVVEVRDFCGLGFHRGPYGACVRNGVPYGYVAAPVVAAPVVVAPPVVCPFGYNYYPRYGRCLLAP
jgi:hypothetical protein